MAGVLIQLKLTLLRHAWRGDQREILNLGASAGLALAAWNWYSAATQTRATLADGLAIAFGIWALIWLMLSTMGGSGSDPLKPELFRLLPLSSRRLTLGLFAASGIGVLPAVTLAGCASLLVAAVRLDPLSVPVAIVAIALSFAFVIALAKVVELAIGTAMQSRVGLEASAMVYAALICLSFIWLPIGLVAAQRGSGTNGLAVVPSIDEIARILPSSWGVVAVEAAGSGNWALTLAALAGLAVLTLVLVVAWAALISARLRGSRRDPHYQVRRLRLWECVARSVVLRTPIGAVIDKELRAWLRQPRRVLTVHVAIWSALFLCVVPGLFGARDVLWPWAGAVFVLVSAVGYANIYGMDGSSLWLSVLTGQTHADVRGRQIAWLAAVGVPATIASIVLTAATGDSAMWPWILALLPVLVGASMGFCPLLGLRLPAPLPDRRGVDAVDVGSDTTVGARLMLQGLVVVVVVPLLGVPTGLIVWRLPVSSEWLAVCVGLALGALYAWLLGHVAAVQLARNGPELLQQMQMRSAATSRQPRSRDSQSGTGAQSARTTAIATLLASVGIILLVPQGLVALLFSWVAPDVRLWFAPMYLPPDLRAPASIILALGGALMLASAGHMWRGRVRSTRPK